MALRVDSAGFAEALSAPVLLADFYSDSCVPCKRISPLLAELEEERPDVRFVKVNVAYEQELTEKYDVMSSPTLILFRNGSETGRLHGAVGKDSIEELING